MHGQNDIKRELSLQDLLDTMQHNQQERHYYKWLIAAIALILILPVLYLTSKCWRQPLLEFASRYVLQQTRNPAKAPVPKPRGKRTCTMQTVDEECEMEEKSVMGNVKGTSGRTIADAPAPAKKPRGDVNKPHGRNEKKPLAPPRLNLRTCGTPSRDGTKPTSKVTSN